VFIAMLASPGWSRYNPVLAEERCDPDQKFAGQARQPINGAHKPSAGLWRRSHVWVALPGDF
jgi:hypothetical protein